MTLIQELNEHLKDMKVKWYLCGGYAIDEYIGRKTRAHKDIDITVSFSDSKKCIEYLKSKGWIIYAPIGRGRFVEVDAEVSNKNYYFDNIWCFREDAKFIKTTNTEDDFRYLEYIEREQNELDFIEVMFNRIENNTFYYDKNHDINIDTRLAYIEKNGIHLLAPEIILLHKSRNLSSESYKQDFDLTVDILDSDRKEWLINAMNIEYPNGHPWINK